MQISIQKYILNSHSLLFMENGAPLSNSVAVKMLILQFLSSNEERE